MSRVLPTSVSEKNDVRVFHFQKMSVTMSYLPIQSLEIKSFLSSNVNYNNYYYYSCDDDDDYEVIY